MAVPKVYNYFYPTLLIIPCLLNLSAAINNTKTNALSEEDVLRTGHNEFMQHYAERAVNTARLMLEDSKVIANDSEEVEKFKNSLTNLINKYEAVKNPEGYSDIVEHFGKLSDYYLEIPEQKRTTDMNFVLTILKKYESDKITEEIKQKMTEFMEKFMQAFANAKTG